MILLSLLIFLVPALSGILLIHLFWAERNGMAVLLKLFIGTGLGLGVNSLVYLLTLIVAPIRPFIFLIQVCCLGLLLFLVIRRERRLDWSSFQRPNLSVVQWLLISAVAVAVILAALVFINLTIARPQGAHDAWSIWNRAARFIYRDPENWSATLSPELYWYTHADYPLLIPLNVAWGWAAVNTETNRVPIIQSAIFVFATIGLLYASVGLARSAGQASLAVLVLISTPAFIDSGYGQISDVPLSFFILAASVSMYLFFRYQKPVLLILSGLATGLAAWTKNEGTLFVVVSLGTLLWLARSKDHRRIVFPYLAGLAFPLIIVLYFKLVLAPGNDILSQTTSTMVAKITDLSRHRMTLTAYFQILSNYASWRINFPLALVAYAVFMKPDLSAGSYLGSKLVTSMILLQIVGYYVIHIVTPHDVEWHVYFSFGRLFFHVFPALLFLFFSSITEPEKVFAKH